MKINKLLCGIAVISALAFNNITVRAERAALTTSARMRLPAAITITLIRTKHLLRRPRFPQAMSLSILSTTAVMAAVGI